MALIKIKIIRLGSVEQFLIPSASVGEWTLERLRSVEVRDEIGRILERHGYSKRVLYPVGVAVAPYKEFVDWEITFHEYPLRDRQGASEVYQQYQCMGWDVQYQYATPPGTGINVSTQRYYGTA